MTQANMAKLTTAPATIVCKQKMGQSRAKLGEDSAQAQAVLCRLFNSSALHPKEPLLHRALQPLAMEGYN